GLARVRNVRAGPDPRAGSFLDEADVVERVPGERRRRVQAADAPDDRDAAVAAGRHDARTGRAREFADGNRRCAADAILERRGHAEIDLRVRITGGAVA